MKRKGVSEVIFANCFYILTQGTDPSVSKAGLEVGVGEGLEEGVVGALFEVDCGQWQSIGMVLPND